MLLAINTFSINHAQDSKLSGLHLELESVIDQLLPTETVMKKWQWSLPRGGKCLRVDYGM